MIFFGNLVRSTRTRRLVLGQALLLLCGCAYHLGPTNGQIAGHRSVQIQQFENQTYQPRLIEAVATALRREVQQDGTYQLATRENGDILVTGVLLKYYRSGLSYDPRDVLTVRDFQISLLAQVTAIDRTSGQTVFSRKVTGATLVRAGNDLASAERQALPLLAEDLARNITSLLADGAW